MPPVHPTYHQLVLSTISSKIAKSILNFNHFIFRSSNSQFRLDLASRALRRCAAFSCMPLQRGIDLAIPILSEENEPSFIFIQVKNTASTFSKNALILILDKMKSQEFSGHESFSGRDSFLNLVFLLNSSGSKKRKRESRLAPVFSISKQANNLVLSGLEAFNIDSEELRDAMESHLLTRELEDLADVDESFDIRYPLTRD